MRSSLAVALRDSYAPEPPLKMLPSGGPEGLFSAPRTNIHSAHALAPSLILTCANCGASYMVQRSQVPAAGRVVKCSGCGARWRATPSPSSVISSGTAPMAERREAAGVVQAQASLQAERDEAPPPVRRGVGVRLRLGRRATERIGLGALALVIVALIHVPFLLLDRDEARDPRQETAATSSMPANTGAAAKDAGGQPSASFPPLAGAQERTSPMGVDDGAGGAPDSARLALAEPAADAKAKAVARAAPPAKAAERKPVSPAARRRAPVAAPEDPPF